MTLQANHLILEALKVGTFSEDVTTKSVMKEAVEAGAVMIMLDNMSMEEMQEVRKNYD